MESEMLALIVRSRSLSLSSYENSRSYCIVLREGPLREFCRPSPPSDYHATLCACTFSALLLCNLFDVLPHRLRIRHVVGSDCAMPCASTHTQWQTKAEKTLKVATCRARRGGWSREEMEAGKLAKEQRPGQKKLYVLLLPQGG